MTSHSGPIDGGRDQYGGWTGVRVAATGFFRVQQIGGRWWFITPEGNGFLSVGVNHVDYREDYSAEFVAFVCRHLADWGFNTIGWSQEVVSPPVGSVPPVHSAGWGPDQYRSATLPYCHLLRFTDMEWYVDEEFPDVSSQTFTDRCDEVARATCAELADDPRLIGYFYADTPNWPKWAEMKGYDLRTPSGRDALGGLARRYYQAIHEAVRRYDARHLLLGDRYKGDSVIPTSTGKADGAPGCVLQASRGTVDVTSVEYYRHGDDFEAKVARWHAASGRPVLLADSAYLAPTDVLKVSPEGPMYVPDQAARGEAYLRFARRAFGHPLVVGWHWCAFGRSRGRKSGLLDGDDQPYTECTDRMRAFNVDELYAVGVAANEQGVSDTHD